MKIPILTYHATNIAGNEYHNNDHVAFAKDLSLIQALNITVIPLHTVVAWLLGQYDLDESKKYVALSFDDGSDLDFVDWQHPDYGFQPSFYSLMRKYPASIHATSFVVASPQARALLKDTCLGGHDIWRDDWWQAAENSHIISIENHSWDHVHVTLQDVYQKDNIKGDFSLIDTYQEATWQVSQASDYINALIENKSVSLFAYPYGHYNDYLVKQYFARHQSICGAFTCQDAYVTSKSHHLIIPRFVCGLHWSKPSQLSNILKGDY